MFDCLARIDLSHLLLENQGCCWTVELNQVRLLNLSGMTSRRKNRHDNPGMCLKQRRARGRKDIVEELVLRLRRTRRRGIDRLVSQASTRPDSLEQ